MNTAATSDATTAVAPARQRDRAGAGQPAGERGNHVNRADASPTEELAAELGSVPVRVDVANAEDRDPAWRS
jgi:hypothetical protein